jgi:hypothetical protein
MEYRIRDICSSLGFGHSKFYNLKTILDCSVPEQNRTEYYYNKGRNLYFTDKGYQWFVENCNTNINNSVNNKNKKEDNSITIYQNQIIEIYKKENEHLKQENDYLKQENSRLLDIISFKEQKEVAKDVKFLGTKENNNFFSRIVEKFKNR